MYKKAFRLEGYVACFVSVYIAYKRYISLFTTKSYTFFYCPS